MSVAQASPQKPSDRDYRFGDIDALHSLDYSPPPLPATDTSDKQENAQPEDASEGDCGGITASSKPALKYLRLRARDMQHEEEIACSTQTTLKARFRLCVSSSTTGSFRRPSHARTLAQPLN
jgi:hypothetical protein